MFGNTHTRAKTHTNTSTYNLYTCVCILCIHASLKFCKLMIYLLLFTLVVRRTGCSSNIEEIHKMYAYRVYDEYSTQHKSVRRPQQQNNNNKRKTDDEQNKNPTWGKRGYFD